MNWQWLKDHLGWLLLLILAGSAGKLWQLVSGGGKAFLGVSSYLRARQKEYVKQLVIERNQLKAANALEIENHARDVQKLTDDLEAMTRAKDLREDISRQDREALRDLMRLCNEHKLDYSQVEIHLPSLPY